MKNKEEFNSICKDRLQIYKAIREQVSKENIRVRSKGYRFKKLDDCSIELGKLNALLLSPQKEKLDLIKNLACVRLLLDEIIAYIKKIFSSNSDKLINKKTTQEIAAILSDIRKMFAQVTLTLKRLDPSFEVLSHQEYTKQTVALAKAHTIENHLLDDIESLYQARYDKYQQRFFGNLYHRFKQWNRHPERQADITFLKDINTLVNSGKLTTQDEKHRLIANGLTLVRLKINSETVNQLPFCSSQLTKIIEEKLKMIQWQALDEVESNFIEFLKTVNVTVPEHLNDYFEHNMTSKPSV